MKKENVKITIYVNNGTETVHKTKREFKSLEAAVSSFAERIENNVGISFRRRDGKLISFLEGDLILKYKEEVVTLKL